MMIALCLIAGTVFLYYGAEWLVKGSSRLALGLGVTPLVVGLTVVAFGTSAPELVVSVQAAIEKSGALAAGNVVGSNICNILLILGLSALISPLKVTRQLLVFDTPLMIVVSLVFAGLFVFGKELSMIDGIILFAGIIAYVIVSIYLSKKAGAGDVAVDPELVIEQKEEIEAEASSGKLKHQLINVGFIVLGLAVLVAGSKLFVMGAVDLARILNVSERVIGLTIVAVGTSLPELATSVIAAIRKEQDIAIGNIVGSNIFNILCIMGVSSMIYPIPASSLDIVDLAVMLASAAILWPVMRSHMLITRLEGAGFLVAYAGYLAFLIFK